MANITPEEVAEGIVNILEAAEGQGIVITDKRFSQSNKELARLLRSQANAQQWRGWAFTYLSIAQQVEVGGQLVDVTYRFFAKFYHFYRDDFQDGISTDTSFKRALFAGNEALNKNLDLGLGNRVAHQRLQSQDDFDIEDLGGGKVNQVCHTAPFIFDVVVTNCYHEE